MPDASGIIGMAGVVPTNVAVTTAGYLVTSGSTGASGSIQLSTSSMNPVTLAASTALNTVSLSASTTATITSVSATTTALMAGSTAGSATATARKGLLAYNQGSSQVLIAYSTAAGTTSYSAAIGSGVLWEMPVPIFVGGVSVAVSTTLTGGTATVLVTELS